MISAPATGCDASSFRNSSSAGGQLEQPSEVNSSTSTGERVPSALAVVFAASGLRWATADNTKTAEKTNPPAKIVLLMLITFTVLANAGCEPPVIVGWPAPSEVSL